MAGQAEGYRIKLIPIEEAEKGEDVFRADTIEEIQAWIDEWLKLAPVPFAVVVMPRQDAAAA
jgi:hypothetical protein